MEIPPRDPNLTPVPPAVSERIGEAARGQALSCLSPARATGPLPPLSHRQPASALPRPPQQLQHAAVFPGEEPSQQQEMEARQTKAKK